MQTIYEGKTKRVLQAGNRLVLKFKDALTGDSSGNITQGGDFVVGHMEGKGAASAKVAAFLFKLIGATGIATHFQGILSDDEIEIILTTRIPLEVIYRAKAFGSFLKRYRGHVEAMALVDLVEFNMKDDALGDPLISRQAILKLGLASGDELRQMEWITREVASILSNELGERGLELVDMKLEFGRSAGKLLVIDELSGDTMRVYDRIQKRMINQIEFARKLGLT